MDAERRTNLRSPTQLTAIVKNQKTGKVNCWLTKNLSPTGVCLVTEEWVERGTKLEIELALPDFAAPCIMPAEVVWVMTKGVSHQSSGAAKTELGVVFFNLPPKTTALLNQYVDRNAPPANLM